MTLIFKIIKVTKNFTKFYLGFNKYKIGNDLNILNSELIDFLVHIKPDIFLCESGKKIYFFDLAERYKKYK
jgi:hypothetical protein